MKKIIVLLFVVFIFSISCKSRKVVVQNNLVKKEVNYIPYYLKVYEADSLYITKNYEKSYEILDSLFRIYKPIQMGIYYEINNYYKLKIILNKKIYLKDFSELISKYRLTDMALKNDSIINIYYIKHKKYLDKNYELLRKKYIASVNLELRNEIKKMQIADQMYRKKDYQLNMAKQDSIDFKNSKRIKEILESNSYPNEMIIGEFNLDNAYVDIGTMLLHTKDKERMEYFMPKILKLIKTGQAPPRAYATMKDQLNLYNDQDQFFGSYNNPTNIPISELNKRRLTIGLPSYTYEKWRFKKLYPKEEY